MKRVTLLALFVGIAFTCGCNTRARFVDVSLEPMHRPYIGAEYVLKVPMHLSGVNLPPGYRKVIDVYVLNPTSPSWDGPELVTRDSIPAGTVIAVESVHRCINCFLDPQERFQAQVQVVNYRKQVDVPVTISLQYLTAPFMERRRNLPKSG